MLLKDCVGEIGTRFKSEDFGEDKSVVAVEEEIGNLKFTISKCSISDSLVIDAYFWHVGGCWNKSVK